MNNSSYRFFQNRECTFFPCHAGADADSFNCMFCYCPLYTLGETCGGNFHWLDNGIKDCSDCLLPHLPEGYDVINEKFPLLAQLAAKK